MKTIHLAYVLAACLMQGIVYAQDGDITEIPFEIGLLPNAERNYGDDIGIEGSGDPSIDENTETTTQVVIPKLEHVVPPEIDNEQKTTSTSEIPCPKPCVCSIEGGTNDFVVDCSGYSLTEFPSPLDPRITSLNLNNNKLNEIPKEIAALKKLKVLKANNNSIMELAAGSVSELPELVVLQLTNNRLLEFPQDLKNSLLLTKLEEIDLGGNDIRTVLTPELFASLKSLRKITLPSMSSNIAEDLCTFFKDSLEEVCVETCKKEVFSCPEAPNKIEDDLFDATLPGMIAFDPTEIQKELDTEKKSSDPQSGGEETTQKPTSENVTNPPVIESSAVTESSLHNTVNNEPTEKDALNSVISGLTGTSHVDPEVKIGSEAADTKSDGVSIEKSVAGIITVAKEIQKELGTEKNLGDSQSNGETTQKPTSENVTVPPVSKSSSVTDFSLRNAVDNEPTEKIALNSIVNAPTETAHVDPDVKIGAKTVDAKSGGGGVDKSVVGIIIAAMVVIVAVIAIKKNWSSIKKKFSSSPRPNERNNVNGTNPEEIPLQNKPNDKSPV